MLSGIALLSFPQISYYSSSYVTLTSGINGMLSLFLNSAKIEFTVIVTRMNNIPHIALTQDDKCDIVCSQPITTCSFSVALTIELIV